MLIALSVLFVIGYLAIALEHPLKVDKTASALLLGMLMWVVYAMGSESIVPDAAPDKLAYFLETHPSLAGKSLHEQVLQYVLKVDILEHLGDIAQTLLFLIGAMTIVQHLTTTIVMLMLLRKLIALKEERWLYAGAIVIAANSGGAWSPIGDITTIMLWVNGNVTAQTLICYVLLPSIVSMAVPLFFIGRKLTGVLAPGEKAESSLRDITKGERNTIFFLGVGGLLFVPVFKSITHLPPFVGILFVLGVLWTFTEIFYNAKKLDKAREHRIPKVIARVDMPSILFFLGILMAVAVLESTGLLGAMAQILDNGVHNIYIIDALLGILSSIVDNVPMVAGVMGMYPIADVAATGYEANFVVDGAFWELLSYCAGVGGSMLIIGTAAGVIAMGLEKISFGWYLRKFSWLALIGYLAGIAVYMGEKYLISVL